MIDKPESVHGSSAPNPGQQSFEGTAPKKAGKPPLLRRSRVFNLLGLLVLLFCLGREPFFLIAAVAFFTLLAFTGDIYETDIGEPVALARPPHRRAALLLILLASYSLYQSI